MESVAGFIGNVEETIWILKTLRKTQKRKTERGSMWMSCPNNSWGIPSLCKKRAPQDGSCQFASIAECIHPVFPLTVSGIRSVAAQGVLKIPSDLFDVLLVAY